MVDIAGLAVLQCLANNVNALPSVKRTFKENLDRINSVNLGALHCHSDQLQAWFREEQSKVMAPGGDIDQIHQSLSALLFELKARAQEQKKQHSKLLELSRNLYIDAVRHTKSAGIDVSRDLKYLQHSQTLQLPTPSSSMDQELGSAPTTTSGLLLRDAIGPDGTTSLESCPSSQHNIELEQHSHELQSTGSPLQASKNL